MISCRSLVSLVLMVAMTLSGSASAFASAVTSDNGPDLAVTALTWSPQNPQVGERVTFTVTIENLGNEQAGSSSLDSYIDDALVASIYISPVKAGAGLEITFTWKAQAGAHNVKVVADAAGNVAESNEANNIVTFAFSVLAPDLVIDNITWVPENPQVGDRVTFTVTVKNQGSIRSAYSYVEFYIDGFSLGHQGVPMLDAGATASATFQWIAPLGSHELKASADILKHVVESDESNNTKSVFYSTLAPDLAIRTITWSPAIPSEGDKVTITVTIGNEGKGESCASRVAYYIDGDYVDSAQVSPLAAGAAIAKSWQLTIVLGPHTFTAVADAGQDNAESDESNNSKTVSLPTPAPDLIVQSITWSPSNPLAANTVTFTVTVKNQGKCYAGLSLVYFYIYNTLYTSYVSALSAGDTAYADFSCTALAGSHTIKAIADAENNVIESDESNNTMSVTFSSSYPAPCDLVVQDIVWSPQSPVVGDVMNFTAAIKNQGSGQSGSFNTTLYIDDAPLSSYSLGPLNAGAATTVAFSWKAQPGSHGVKIMTDSGQGKVESDEGNNARATTISVSASDLFIREATWWPASPAAGCMVTFSVTIGNKGSYKSGHSYVGYFVNGSSRGQHYVEELEPGTAVTRTFTTTFDADPWNIRIVADVNNEASELDENNNEKSISAPDEANNIIGSDESNNETAVSISVSPAPVEAATSLSATQPDSHSSGDKSMTAARAVSSTATAAVNPPPVELSSSSSPPKGIWFKWWMVIAAVVAGSLLATVFVLMSRRKSP